MNNMTENNAAQPVLTDDEIREIQGTHLNTIGSIDKQVASVIVAGRAIESALLSKLRAESVQAGDERAADLFREALAWGYVYGPKLNKDQWERMRDETAQQFSKRLTALAIPPVDDGELRTAFNEWIDKTDFIQQRIASGALPMKYLGWHRADVMRALIDAALASAPVAGEARAVVYPPDGTESPFTVINLGSGAVQMGPCLHDGRLGGLWFGKNGQGMGHEQILNRHAHHGETIAVVTFASVQGLDVMLGELLRCRKQYFPAAPAAPQASEAVPLAQYGYQALFDAIGAAVKARDKDHLEISVQAFREALKTQADKDGGDCAKGEGDEAMRDALEMLIREAQAVADDHHRPRYTRLDEAIQSARAALSPTQPTEQGERDE
jgi:hypothetical protein